jgi:hypothetical protein
VSAPAGAAALHTARDVAALHDRFPGWLITADADTRLGMPVFSARRPGLEIVRYSADALETELLAWARAPGAPDLAGRP